MVAERLAGRKRSPGPGVRSTKVAAPNDPALTRISSFLGYFRWLFMPLGLTALIAVGIHAAADTVDDRLLDLVQQLDTWFDTLFARTESLQGWVDRIGSREQTLIARALTLAWELATDLAIALPALGYKEDASKAFNKESWRALLQRFKAQPTPMRILRPVLTGIFALAGAYAIARMVEGALFLSLRAGVAPDAIASPMARAFAFGAFALVAVAFGARATLRALQHADGVCTPKSAVSASDRLAMMSGQKKVPKAKNAWTAGLIGTALAVPLALAAVLDALPLLSFFR
jgi:hypothetical protein